MAVLDETQRSETHAEWMRRLSRIREELNGVTKTDLRAAINATDQWIEDNQGAFNTALPTATRTNLTAKQKALLFFFVADKRFGVL